jgi:hypothetical protein
VIRPDDRSIDGATLPARPRDSSGPCGGPAPSAVDVDADDGRFSPCFTIPKDRVLRPRAIPDCPVVCVRPHTQPACRTRPRAVRLALVFGVISFVVGSAVPVRAQVATATASTPPPPARAIDPGAVPTSVDVVQRGLRLRVDLGGRYGSVGLPDPPVRLEVDDVVHERDDLDVTGAIVFGYDRMFGLPMQADLLGDFLVDANPDSPVSPFLDDQSAAPRLRLYSAFVGLSAGPGEPALQPFRVQLGRMTELVESPITYDGLALGVRLHFGRDDRFSARVWGGLDAPQRIVDDPFSRTSRRAVAIQYRLDPTFVSNPGAWEATRTALVAPNLNAVGGLVVDGRFAGVGFLLSHAAMPASTTIEGQLLPLQRSTVGVSYRLDTDGLLANVGLDAKLTDLVPRSTSLRGDALTGDGATRVGLVARLQFLEDTTAYDATFAARHPAQVFQLDDVNALESLRVRDQIRHLNFGPPQEHVFASFEFERQLPASLQVLVRARVRQHLDEADVDMFRTNLYEAAAGLGWNPGYALDVGAEVSGGTVDSGKQDDRAYDLRAEGVVTYLEPRVWVRSALLEGRLRNHTEVFVRRSDISTRALDATGQWGGALATTTTFDVLPTWALSLRLDGDALSPIDSLNASTYFGALVASSLRF